MKKTVDDWLYWGQSTSNNGKSDKTIKYLIENGLKLTPFVNKHPFLTGWRNYEYENIDNYDVRLTNWVKSSTDEYSHNVGLIMDGSMVTIDFDPGHHESDKEYGIKKRKELITALGENARTIYASKPGSYNLHIFYKNNYDLQMRNTQGKFYDSDVFSINQSVNVMNPYKMQGIDYDKPFIEQLSDTPDSIVIWYSNLANDNKEKQRKINHIKGRVNNDDEGARWLMSLLTKRSMQGCFQKGRRNNDLFKVSCFALSVGVSSFTVKLILEQFVNQVLPTFDESVDLIVNSAEKYV